MPLVEGTAAERGVKGLLDATWMEIVRFPIFSLSDDDVSFRAREMIGPHALEQTFQIPRKANAVEQRTI